MVELRTFVLMSFVVYLVYFGITHPLSEGFAIQEMGPFFIIMTIIFSLLTVISLYKKEIIDRIGLAVDLFGLSGSIVFILNNPFAIYY